MLSVTHEHVDIVFLILVKDLLLQGIQMEQAYPLQRLMGHLQDHAFLMGLCSQEGNELCRVFRRLSIKQVAKALASVRHS